MADTSKLEGLIAKHEKQAERARNMASHYRSQGNYDAAESKVKEAESNEQMVAYYRGLLEEL